MYFSAKEILAQLEGTDKRICDLVIQNETELFETPYDKIMEMLEEAPARCGTTTKRAR